MVGYLARLSKFPRFTKGLAIQFSDRCKFSSELQLLKLSDSVSLSWIEACVPIRSYCSADAHSRACTDVHQACIKSMAIAI